MGVPRCMETLRACSSKGRNGIPGRNISSWGRKSDLKICPEAETIRPKITIRPLDEQAPLVQSLKFLEGGRIGMFILDQKIYYPLCTL